MKVIEEYRNQLFESDPLVGKPAGCREGISVFFHHHSFHLGGNFAGKSSIFLGQTQIRHQRPAFFSMVNSWRNHVGWAPPAMVVGL